MQEIQSLLRKYDVPTPRYTSYPTVPYWDSDTINQDIWEYEFVKTLVEENGALSIYIHLPFCESLCTFCACNKRITKNHDVEAPYITSVLNEWSLYTSKMTQRPRIQEIHLGGGTPTFFSPGELARLIKGITAGAEILPDHEFSIEVHPNATTKEHLEVLAELGFNRVSIGIQDFDPGIQYIINRHQTYEQTALVFEWARALNYESINADLIYGLPTQKLDHIHQTIDLIRQLAPERIAYYSYAHVPWKSKVQRRYSDEDLPKAAQKWQMYHEGAIHLSQYGYDRIGMDHFALPTDKLSIAHQQGTLHRNFMGYTTNNNRMLIGLGASAISDSGNALVQNEKVVEAYQERINKNEIPIINGHLLDQRDSVIRKHILDIMCQGETILDTHQIFPEHLEYIYHTIDALSKDGLVVRDNQHLRVTELGSLFVRNICAALDAYLYRNNIESRNMFSAAI